jgi:cytochrome c oxidase cbb3-type subunit 3
MAESAPEGRKSSRPPRRGWTTILIVLAVVAVAVVAYTQVRNYVLGSELVMTSPDSVPLHPELVNFAIPIGKAAFAANCASCHGADMKGMRAKGSPDLTDNIWLYDYGRVSDIERTILYGIRSGLGKTHNVTDMPAIGRGRALDPDEIHDVIAYVLSLNKQPQDQAAVTRGEKIFMDKGVCYDCHSREATGIPDYGTPSLISGKWLFGGDVATLYRSIYDGRHGVCPAWIGKLSFTTIRALAVYIHAVSKESPESPTRTALNGS